MHATRRLLRHGSVYTLGTVLQLSAAALVVPVLAHRLSPAQYGVVALALTIQLLLGTVVGGGLSVAVTRTFYDEGPDGGAAASRRLIVSTALVALPATALVALSAPLWIDALGSGDSTVLGVGIALAFPAAISTSALALLRVQERPAAFLSVTLLASVGAQFAGVAALVAVDDTPRSYLFGYGGAVSLAALLGLVHSGAIGHRPTSSALLRAGLALGLPTIPIDLSAYVLSTGDRFVIQVIDGSAAVGRYQVAYAIGTLALTFLSALNVAWLAITFGLAEDERWPALAQMTTLVAQIGALFCAGIALIAPFALQFVAPAAYTPNDLVPVTALVALSAVPWAVFLSAGQVLVWYRNTTPLLWISPLAVVVNLGLVVLLLPPLGLEGAAAATLLALSLQAALAHRSAARMAPAEWDYRGLAMALAGGIAAVTLAIALPGTTAGDVGRGVAALVVAVVAVRTVRTHLLMPNPARAASA